VASEIAFLAMDLDRYQRADLSQYLVDRYVELSQDKKLMNLLNFYKCYRACVRGKVESFKLDDLYISAEEKQEILAAAKTYFDLACFYTRTMPLLLITAGLVGTGKTTLAKALEQSLGFTVISSDVIRKRLANIPLAEHHLEEFQSGIYSPDFSARTYDEIFHQANEILSQGKSVILDASFARRDDRIRAKRLAEKKETDFMVLECVLSDEKEIKRRLEQRMKEETPSDGRWTIYQQQKQSFDIINEFPAQQHLAIDMSQPMDKIVNLIRSQL
jgi:hypothetical protein